MKTKRSMKERECHQCDSVINKGDQYGQKSVSLGKQTSWAIDQRPTEEIPSYAWSDFRVKVDICAGCAA
jgi:hypothetical protein